MTQVCKKSLLEESTTNKYFIFLSIQQFNHSSYIMKSFERFLLILTLNEILVVSVCPW